jgi:hypothetical protein
MDVCLTARGGRPNPPYVIFKHDGKVWQRFFMQELPVEFNNINLVNNTKDHAEHLMDYFVVKADAIKRFNSSLTQPEF